MQIRCTSCTRTISLAPSGELPAACPHCAGTCVPQRLGPFVPLRLVATGGMGEVYLARHAELGTEVALKLLPAMPLDAATAVRERFAREARLTARVRHPGVVKVLDSDVAGDRPYLVLEFVDGETLRQRLQHGPLPVVQAARIAATTADVLAAAHAEGVLHRDIKPDNVMLARDGSVRVLDFGIARAMTDDAPLTRTGEILGTPEYMAPEQLLDGPEATDARTDVHALGVLLYELLTARSPFRGTNLFQALKLVESLVPGSPSSLRAAVPPALDAVVMKALQKLREDRFASAAAFAAAVRTAVPEAALPETGPPVGRSTHLWLALAVVALVVFSGFLLLRQLAGPVVGAFVAGVTGAERIDAAADFLKARTRLHHLLDEGQWALALQRAERAMADGDREALAIAREAFLLAHFVWPLATGLPPWVGCCDERQRERLFGGSLEDPLGVDESSNAMILLARGEPAAALHWLQESTLAQRDVRSEYGGWHQERSRRRLLLLAAHLTGADAASVRALPQRLDLADDATADLLSLRQQAQAERAASFVEYAARMPIDQPEHWLALRCADACRAPLDARDAETHAEMAWQNGAGELAVQLDSALFTLRPPGMTRAPLAAQPAQRLLRRVGSAEAGDAPASVGLRALLHWAAGEQAEAERVLASLPVSTPATMQPFQRWLVATKGSDAAELALQRGLAAARIGDEGAARAQFVLAATPAAALCSWLLDRSAGTEALPPVLFGSAIVAAAELVRGDPSQVDRLLAAAAAPGTEPPHFLRLAVLAGAEVDFTRQPWSAHASGAARMVFDKEVNGGLRR